MTTGHTDISRFGFVAQLLPRGVQPYARLMRLDRPIGTWLLLFPCWWGVALSSQAWPDVFSLFMFAVGALVMRGAGCAINDLYDRRFDVLVERTRTRPLVNGDMTPLRAVLFICCLLFAGLGVLLTFNLATLWLGIASLGLVFVYPLAKRVTFWPQLVLGLAFNWGALMGSCAVTGQVSPAALLLYGAGVFWTLGYDTIYAHQDKRDDAAIGVKSLALYFEARSRFWITCFYASFLVLLAAAGAAAQLHWIFYPLLLCVGAHLLWQVRGWDMDNPESCLQRFRSNSTVGWLVFLAIMAGKIP